MYRCSGCNKKLEKIEQGSTKCPFCGSRILFKMRPEVVRKVKAK